MYKATKLIGVPIRDIKKGEINGCAKNIIFDAKGNKGHLEIDKKCLVQAEVLPISDIVGIGDDYLLIEKKSAIKKVIAMDKELRTILKDSYMLIGVEVIEGAGRQLGKVVDLEVAPDGVLSKIFLESGDEIEKEKIISICENTIFVDFSGAIREGIAEKEDEEAVAIEESEDETVLPIGLTVSKRVVSQDGEFKVKAGTVITEEIIAEASEHDALVDLALCAK